MDHNIAISYNGIQLTQSVVQSLPEKVRGWLDFYNSLSPDEQDTITYVPAELALIVSEQGMLTAGKTVFTAGSDTIPPTTMYTHEGYSICHEGYWKEREKKANCYAYAMNVVVNGDDHRLRPGNVRGKDIDRPTCYLDEVAYLLAENVIDDSLSSNLGGITNAIRCDFADTPNRTNQYRVALVVGYEVGDPKREFKDYHWYKEDASGNWSHKRGSTSVVWKDSDNVFITTAANPPHLCARKYKKTDYSFFACYFMITHN